MGRFPLTMKAYERILKYYQHVGKSKNEWKQEALLVNKDLDRRGTNSWYNSGLYKFIKMGENTIESKNFVVRSLNLQ